jgi:hypothetical protein
MIGAFLWVDYDRYKKGKGELVSSTKLVEEGYEEIEISGERFLENKKYGLLVKVPENWIVNIHPLGVDFYSPEVEFDERGSLIMDSIREGACGAGIEILESVKLSSELVTDAEYFAEFIERIKDGSINNKDDINNEIIMIDDKESLRTNYIKEDKKKLIEIKIPIDQVVYSFTSGIIFSDKCVEEFEGIIQGIKINR